MSVPKKRRTSSSRKRRASHFALKAKSLVKCEKCNELNLPHHACKKCGNYKGRSIFEKVYASVKSEKAKNNSSKKQKEQKGTQDKAK